MPPDASEPTAVIAAKAGTTGALAKRQQIAVAAAAPKPQTFALKSNFGSSDALTA
jgi:hypothetical protein